MMSHLFMKPKSLQRIFFWPVVLFSLTLFGLIFALIEDEGVLEQLGVIAISITLAVIMHFYMFKKS